MKELTNGDIIFGIQLDSLVERHDDLLRYPHAQNGISEMYPDLKGHERSMVRAVGKAVIERMGLMEQIGAGGLAMDLIEARRALGGRIVPRD